MNDDNSKETPLNNQRIQSASETTAIEDIRRMFVDETQIPRIVNNNQTPAKRAAFAKTHGIVSATFQVVDDLPEKYQIGIFKPGKRYTAWVRFSSDIAQTAPDLNSTVGVGIKLFDVYGNKAIDQEVNGTTLDFILQNTEVFFASDATDMANFKAAAMSGNLDRFLVENPELAAVLNSMDKKVDTLLGEPYWSCVPFKFGHEFCKFKLYARTLPTTTHKPNFSGTHYLANDLAQRLIEHSINIDFFVQLRNNPATQSITDARNLWKESEAIPVRVAILTLHRQNINSRQQQEYGESLSFNLWRTLLEMQPVGSIAEARKVIYQSSAEVRRNVNGQSIGEADKPRAYQLANMPTFIPTRETPWPIGTLGNVTEDFQGYGPMTLAPNQYTTRFQEITISSRDVPYSVAINNYGSLNNTVQKDDMNKGITYVNYPYTTGTLRLLFEKNNMQSVSFDLRAIIENLNSNGLLTISAYKDNTLIQSYQAGDINARIMIQPSSGRDFNLLTVHYNSYIYAFNLQNFTLTYA